MSLVIYSWCEYCRYGSGVFSFRTIVEGITASFNTEFQLAQVLICVQLLTNNTARYSTFTDYKTTTLISVQL